MPTPVPASQQTIPTYTYSLDTFFKFVVFLQPGVVDEKGEDNEDEGYGHDYDDEIRSDPALFLLVVFPQVGRTLLLVPRSILPPGTQRVFPSFKVDLSVVARTSLEAINGQNITKNKLK